MGNRNRSRVVAAVAAEAEAADGVAAADEVAAAVAKAAADEAAAENAAVVAAAADAGGLFLFPIGWRRSALGHIVLPRPYCPSTSHAAIS